MQGTLAVEIKHTPVHRLTCTHCGSVMKPPTEDFSDPLMKTICLFLVSLLLAACTVLPHGNQVVISKWESFEQAMQAYQQVQPYVTSLEQLNELGFTPDSQANVRILNRAEIVERLIATPDHYHDSLPRGLRECLNLTDDCYAHEVRVRVTRDKRHGNVVADFLNFRRKVETRGWEFNALIVLIKDLVVYKSWSGTPQIHKRSDTTNPLGPLQSIGPALTPGPDL